MNQGPFASISPLLSAVIGECDPGTRVFRRQGASSEISPWFDALGEHLDSKLVPLADVPAYAPVSRAAVQKKMKQGGLTVFCFHVVQRLPDRFGRKPRLRQTPYAYVPIEEVKVWAAELNGRGRIEPQAIGSVSAASNSFPTEGFPLLAPPADSPAGSPAAKEPEPMLLDSVLSALTDMITEGHMGPGDRLNERVLSEKLKVSRTPLREAFKVLARIGLVELLPNRGARVARLTETDLRHLFELIGSLEALSGRLAAERITPAELTEIKRIHREMAEHHAKGDLSTYFRLNQLIHERIVCAAKNPVLLETYIALSSRIRRPRYLSNLNNRQRWDMAMAEHAEIIRALEKRSASDTSRLLAEHLQHKYEAVSEHV